VRDYPVEYVAGGSTQNSIRCAQWMLGNQAATVMTGCVGNDNNAQILKEAAEKNGVKVAYVHDDTHPTGRCAALITGKERTLCADIAAANMFREEHIKRPENWAHVEKAHFIYIAGFFLTVSPPTVMLVAQHCADNNKVFSMNLAAPFISQFFFDPLIRAMPFCDYVFGNESEADAFAAANKWETRDVKEIAKKIAELPKANSKRERTVVITQGQHPTIVYHDGKLHEYPVLVIAPEKIVDTNGAGDSFVGGFYSQLVTGQPLHRCVHAGHYCAREVIQRTGCTFPDTPDHQKVLEFECVETTDDKPADH